MEVQQARVPVLDETGRFPDAYAPPSVAANTTAAQEARTGAETAQGKAETARTGAEDARDAAHGSALAASGSASDAQDAVNAVPAAVTSTLNTWFLRGNGSPVGVITPTSAGVQYVDLAATNGARVWISTGTTASAWKVVDGDTGWRDISSLVINGWTTSVLRLRRINSHASFYIDGLSAANNTGDVATAVIPFIQQPFYINNLAVKTATGSVSSIGLSSAGQLFGRAAWTTQSVKESLVSWPVTASWPTTLPGTTA